MDKRQKRLLVAFILSILLHIGFLGLLDWQNWLIYDPDEKEQPIPEEVTFVYPENKPIPKRPREVVQNMNETDEIPTDANLLSDRNSKARNPEKTDQIGNTPMSTGNTPFSNLSGAQARKSFSPKKNKTFNKDALRGSSTKTPSEEYREQQQNAISFADSIPTNQMLNQKNFSVENVGAITLSTYKWNWAPYLHKMKAKLARVAIPPIAFYMGLIHGKTVVIYEVSREGQLLNLRVLDHQGHESLRISSINAFESLFPFLPLPEDFPEKTLTIVFTLVYPDLRQER